MCLNLSYSRVPSHADNRNLAQTDLKRRDQFRSLGIAMTRGLAEASELWVLEFLILLVGSVVHGAPQGSGGDAGGWGGDRASLVGPSSLGHLRLEPGLSPVSCFRLVEEHLGPCTGAAPVVCCAGVGGIHSACWVRVDWSPFHFSLEGHHPLWSSW